MQAARLKRAKISLIRHRLALQVHRLGPAAGAAKLVEPHALPRDDAGRPRHPADAADQHDAGRNVRGGREHFEPRAAIDDRQQPAGIGRSILDVADARMFAQARDHVERQDRCAGIADWCRARPARRRRRRWRGNKLRPAAPPAGNRIRGWPGCRRRRVFDSCAPARPHPQSRSRQRRRPPARGPTRPRSSHARRRRAARCSR